MPPPPELRNRGGEVRRIEILHKLDAQNFGRTHGNGGIAAEVAVDLHGKEHRSRDEIPAGEGRDIPIDRIHKDSDPVRQDDFQEIAPEHQHKALSGPVKIEAFGGIQLLQKVLAPLNGPRHQLGEEGDKKGIAQKVLLRADLPPVHVHGIAQSLEGKEGNANGQQDVEFRNV